MGLRELSKMQIRAEVMMILQQLYSYEEASKEQQDKYIQQLQSINNRTLILEILAKELTRVDSKKGNIIVSLLTELGTLEQLKDTLWSLIKDPKLSDAVKDLAGITLRNLGDNSDPEVFLSYLNNPKDIIDKETKKILEVALVNPDAQIDFLDFLFALPEDEQINLINSLKEDYPDICLANMLIAALESRPTPKVKQLLVEALGETKTALAVPILMDILETDEDQYIKKLAKKSLNMIKLSGVNIDESKQDMRGLPVSRISEIHECHASVIDGSGSQGLLVSRIKANKDILMFSVVVNETDGIVDCFGFNGISENDFARIINKFQEESTRVQVSPEYCKYVLTKAESLNKDNNTSIPYEYIAWKILLFGVGDLPETVEEIVENWQNVELINQGAALYKHPDFRYWFMDEIDHPVIKDSIQTIIDQTIKKQDYFIENIVDFINWLEDKISSIILQIYDDRYKEIYRNRLINIAYLLDLQGLDNLKIIASSVAISLKSDSILPVEKSPFIRELMRRTVSEGFLRYKYNQTQQEKSSKAFLTRTGRDSIIIPKIDSNNSELDAIINILYNIWQKN